MSLHQLNVCVFCGSNNGNNPAFREEAEAIARGLCQQGLGLVYGGASVGLMGLIADTVLKGGGKVTGVIPDALVSKEVSHQGLPDLRVVRTMHERKKMMYDLSAAFVVLPGGFGTLDELFEVLTWCQIGVHQKPIFLHNVAGFFDHLLAHIDGAVSAGLIKAEHRKYLVVTRNSEELLAKIAELNSRLGLID